MHHLTLRVAWHDSRWNGAVCRAPSNNSFCVALKRIRAEREDAKQDRLAEQWWSDLDPNELPPCVAESGGFMNARPWAREFRHPYAELAKAASTHGPLLPTTINIPEFATFAVPFAWMLRENQGRLEERSPEPLPPDEDPPFPSPWVFGSARQNAILEMMFRHLTPERSLAFFYCKEGHPLGDDIPRLIVGVGRILSVGDLLPYRSRGPRTYPLWDRIIRHSIRLDGSDGFLLPYHDYLEPTGDPDEDARRLGLAREIAVDVTAADVRTFSYAAELATPDVALSALTRSLDILRLIREHGVAQGPWERREDWVNARIAEAWSDRGAFPGAGAALEALGLRLGTSLVLELTRAGKLTGGDDPWPLLDALLRGDTRSPHPGYGGDLQAVRPTWLGLSEDRRELLRLLSRFALTADQARRWFDPMERNAATSSAVADREILDNPYRITESDLGDESELPVSVEVIDRGMLPDSTIAVRHPLPERHRIDSEHDRRRIRAALVTVLRRAAAEGDSLLSVSEALQRLGTLDLARPAGVGSDWVSGNRDFLAGTVDTLELITDIERDLRMPALQLTEHRMREEWLAKVVRARADRGLESLGADWRQLLITAIETNGGRVDPSSARHTQALDEQAAALELVTTRRLSVLVGRAGTGKTSVLGALVLQPQLRAEGILLLAPTGKARVRLGRVAGAEAMTIAQFLNSLGRYDGKRQRPLFTGKDKYRRERNIIIDECSMLTLDDIVAVLQALDLNHAHRLILVGDPNQLPPIGVGRPFADIVGLLETSPPDRSSLSGALGRLAVELRTVQGGGPSDALRLAGWFTREPQPVDSDRILSDIELMRPLSDLEIAFWRTPEELRTCLLEQMVKNLGLSGEDDVGGFNRELGFDERGWVPYDRPDGAENFQILSPVRSRSYGVQDLNRWVQQHFRSRELTQGRKWFRTLGDEEIVSHDKVIQVWNERRKGYRWDTRVEDRVYLANGEVGIVARDKEGWFNVAFAGRPNLTVSYRGRDFPGGAGPLELAYALTIHKAQGSEFQTVFVVLPRHTALLSRELLYTALTRSRRRLVLLVEGEDPSFLHELTQRSETARRNSNLFYGVVREHVEMPPFAEHLIHRTDRGELVRSKSELVIANMLHHMGVDYLYERILEGTTEPGRLRPDFSFFDPAGDLVIWEHLGMLHREDYQRGWEWKRGWYERNGFIPEATLFTTSDDERGGLDSAEVRRVAEKISAIL